MKDENVKVLIVVKGGVVQSIYSSNSNLIYDILDYDNEELVNDIEEENLLKLKAEGLDVIL